jgi:uncharacterized protein YidB (DUF937 family)
MGLLDQFIGGGQGQGGSGLGSLVAAGALLALAAHGASRQQTNPAAPAGGGLGGLLNGMLGSQGGGPAGGLLSGLGGSAALQALLDRFSERGYGAQVSSWLGAGPNQPIQPQQVQEALGENALGQLEQQTGAPRQTLLQELASALPHVVDRASPNGQIEEGGLASLLQGLTPH